MLFLLRSSQDYLIFFKHPALNLVDFPLNLLCPFQRPEIYKHSSLELHDACSQPFLRVWQHDCIPAVLISNLSVTSTKKCINCHLGKLCNCLGIRGQHLPICTQSFLTATLISSPFSGGGKTWPATWNTLNNCSYFWSYKYTWTASAQGQGSESSKTLRKTKYICGQ